MKKDNLIENDLKFDSVNDSEDYDISDSELDEELKLLNEKFTLNLDNVESIFRAPLYKRKNK